MPPDDELPTGLGAPAERALAGAGIATLSDLARLSEPEVADLHGMGPKALGRLRSALTGRGLTFAPPPPDPAVAAYIAGLGPDHRRLFDQLQALVLEVRPEAEIRFAYQIPLYRVGRLHVGLNASRAGGVTLTTTSPDHIAEFTRRHPRFRTNKASIQFGFDDDLPADDIRQVVRRATTP